MIEIKNYVKFRQDSIDMYLFTLNSSEFIENSRVDYYDYTLEEGYQRQLNPTHFRKIANYMLENENSLLPTAIIAAIDRDSLEHEKDSIQLKKDFRIVDGQHRREALLYIKSNEEVVFTKRISKLNFPIVLMLIDKNVKSEYINEIKAFIDINKKGRKVNTDLAYSLLKRIYETQIAEEEVISEREIYELIAINVAKRLNKNHYSCWLNKIKSGGKDDYGKPISQNAFINSLIPFIKTYCKENISGNEKSGFVEEISSEIEEIIVKIWSMIGNTWEDCFFWDDDFESFSYDKNYNIQKGLGVYSLHGVLAEVYEYDQNKYLEIFEEALCDCDIVDDMWRVGGDFSVFNSKAGFKEIKNKIIIWN